MHVIPEKVSSQAIESGPNDPAKRIKKEKAALSHPIGPRQKGGPGTQYRDKATKEDDLAAMLTEEILPHFELAFIQANDVARAAQ